MAAEEDEGVVRDADERGGEDGRERHVVVAVVQQAQVGEQVDDLLLAEVALARRAVGRQAGGAELLLVPLGVGSGGEEQDDLPRSGVAGGDEVTDAPSNRARLAAPPVDVGSRVRRLLSHE